MSGEEIAQWEEIGQSLGYAGDALVVFIKEQLDMVDEERRLDAEKRQRILQYEEERKRRQRERDERQREHAERQRERDEKWKRFGGVTHSYGGGCADATEGSSERGKCEERETGVLEETETEDYTKDKEMIEEKVERHWEYEEIQRQIMWERANKWVELKEAETQRHKEQEKIYDEETEEKDEWIILNSGKIVRIM